jgi:phytoene/squalene synthetase
VCTGLQLVEHWQDVREDALAGRVYLPGDDLDRFGVDPADLTLAPPARSDLRALMVFEVARAREWLDRGTPLVASLTGTARLAVAGFVAGGHAALDGIARRDFDVLSPPGRPGAVAVARHIWLTSRGRHGEAA